MPTLKILTDQVGTVGVVVGGEVVSKDGHWQPRYSRFRRGGIWLGGGMVAVGDASLVVEAAKRILAVMNSGGE